MCVCLCACVCNLPNYQIQLYNYSCVCIMFLHITHCIVVQLCRTCHSGSWSHFYGHTAVGVFHCRGNECVRELQVNGQLYSCGQKGRIGNNMVGISNGDMRLCVWHARRVCVFACVFVCTHTAYSL